MTNTTNAAIVTRTIDNEPVVLDKAMIKKIAKACYPEYTGRKIRVEVEGRYTMEDYWDGGTRRYARAYDLATGNYREAKDAAHVPWNAAAHASFDIPQGTAIVEHMIFCGKDLGITIYVPGAPALPASDSAPCGQLGSGQ